MIRFIHTADWQLGKPFAGVADTNNRVLLQQERLSAIIRLGEKAHRHQAQFVLVAGDTFDSPSPTNADVSAACGAIGKIGLPVYLIPGNHDAGGAGSLWERDFFKQEQQQLAPNLRVLLTPEPVELEDAVLFPCPLLRRHTSDDPATWLRNIEFDRFKATKPRIVLAHGTTQNFGSTDDYGDDEDPIGGATNFIRLDHIPDAEFDYIALGDWHGTKQVGSKAWYAGTPELDRFKKGENNNPGNILLVEAGRGLVPKADIIKTGRINWHEIRFSFPDDNGLTILERILETQLGQNTQSDLLRLQMDGSLGMEAYTRLMNLIVTYQSRLIRLKLDNKTLVSPTEEEMSSLTRRIADPGISRVAKRLEQLVNVPDPEQGATARVALLELYAACL